MMRDNCHIPKDFDQGEAPTEPLDSSSFKAGFVVGKMRGRLEVTLIFELIILVWVILEI